MQLSRDKQWILPDVFTRRNYSVRPYQSGDIQKLEVLGDEREVVLSLEDFYLDLVEQWDKFTHCGICFYNRRPFYVGGSWRRVDESGVLDVFIVPDKSSLTRPGLLVRSVRRWLHRLDIAGCQALRTESIDAPHIDRFMKALRFVYTNEKVSYTIAGRVLNYKVWRRENGIRVG